MKKALPYISFIGIILVIYSLFPNGKAFFSNLANGLTDQTNEIVEDYEGAKSEIQETVNTVNQTQESINETIDNVNQSMEKLQETTDKLEGITSGS